MVFTQVKEENMLITFLDQIIRKLTAYIKKKKKIDVKSSTIKEQLMLFVRCDIVKPTFDSQTKDYMTTPVNKFGSSCEVSDKFIENIAKMGVMDAACALTEVKENKSVKKTDGAKTKSVIVFMTDQDLDGSHIKGLGINLLDAEWQTLLNIPDFVGFMNTPILKAKKGSKEMRFYNDGEYDAWKKENSTSGWKIKYYKGLGTSTSKEFKEYMEHKKIVHFVKNDDET